MSDENKFELPENPNTLPEKKVELPENPTLQEAPAAPKISFDSQEQKTPVAPSFSLPKTSAAPSVKFGSSSDFKPAKAIKTEDDAVSMPAFILDFAAAACAISFAILIILQK